MSLLTNYSALSLPKYFPFWLIYLFSYTLFPVLDAVRVFRNCAKVCLRIFFHIFSCWISLSKQWKANIIGDILSQRAKISERKCQERRIWNEERQFVVSPSWSRPRMYRCYYYWFYCFYTKAKMTVLPGLLPWLLWSILLFSNSIVYENSKGRRLKAMPFQFFSRISVLDPKYHLLIINYLLIFNKKDIYIYMWYMLNLT